MTLTLRETEVVDALCLGLTMAKIAERLHLSPYTVKFHLSRIYRKLNAVNGLHAVAIYTAYKILRPVENGDIV